MQAVEKSFDTQEFLEAFLFFLSSEWLIFSEAAPSYITNNKSWILVTDEMRSKHRMD